MIIDAFFKLVNEKGYHAVTVQDIANEAMINRTTFYAHFKDKQNLFEYVFDFAVNVCISVLDSDNFVQDNCIRIKYIESLLTRGYIDIYENKQFFLTVMESNTNELLRKRLAKILSEKYSNIFAKLKITENDIEVPIDFIIEYITSIFIGTLHWWITSNTDMTANHLAQLVIKLVSNSHLTVLGIKIEQ
ncbi:TetR/AcrR family transcriptional regulator [Melissococcus plutonius]|nr:TetR/AcrR family transcriptional regulator [Melissococcus plutonius]MCV2498034.1 TetR/AcrR family transcriptional regulator [Melissococcus plutonius]MCV2501776.1 TetR/AcrR family transcriptional regulator [Melissococcus plutonius]MCV2504413.1 TetR/AcrR family transcriptional regulator [Melissococcus plutonius]MCV2506649.1 TetR/AcrR family transcriptional regulator [Melissococcus plutonius]MCV2519027.1 TetR/AcrR family transcriptional regulator [Melissococcus plutonius]